MPILQNLSRRRFLQASAASLLAAQLWPGVLAAADGDAGDGFHFLVINDLHYLTAKCGTWFEGLVKQLKGHKERPAFCVLAGDLSEDGKKEQIGPVKEIFKGLGCPIHVVPGNHDFHAQDGRTHYDAVYPDSLNYLVEYDKWQCVFLDSTDGNQSKAAVGRHTLQWLDEMLPRLDKKRALVVCTHFPLGWLVPLRSTNADDVLGRFKEYNLQAIFNGHFHGSSERLFRGVTITTNRCCSFSRTNHDGTKEKGYFLCRAKDGKVTRTFVEAKPDMAGQ
jgi:3',5'-cyclic AMP phosphodiesterase CpdA